MWGIEIILLEELVRCEKKVWEKVVLELTLTIACDVFELIQNPKKEISGFEMSLDVSGEKKTQKKIAQEFIDEETIELIETETDDSPTVRYTTEQEEIFGAIEYGTAPLDYIKMFYGDEKRKGRFKDQEEEGEYKGMALNAQTKSETMSQEEAVETLIDLQYAAALADSSRVSVETKKRFATWVMFNQGKMMFFQNVYGVTGDVDYSSI